MPNYTDKLLEKIQKERRAQELKEAQLNEPLFMAASDDADMEFDLDNSVSDSEFAESFFNDEAHGDEVKVDMDEPEEAVEEFDTLEEMIDKEIKDKKKKKGKVGELEEEGSLEAEVLYDQQVEPMNTFSEEETVSDIYDQSQMEEYVEPIYDQVEPASIIDDVALSETYEQQVLREQQEFEDAMAANSVVEQAEQLEPQIEADAQSEMVSSIEPEADVEWIPPTPEDEYVESIPPMEQHVEDVVLHHEISHDVYAEVHENLTEMSSVMDDILSQEVSEDLSASYTSMEVEIPPTQVESVEVLQNDYMMPENTSAVIDDVLSTQEQAEHVNVVGNSSDAFTGDIVSSMDNEEPVVQTLQDDVVIPENNHNIIDNVLALQEQDVQNITTADVSVTDTTSKVVAALASEDVVSPEVVVSQEDVPTRNILDEILENPGAISQNIANTIEVAQDEQAIYIDQAGSSAGFDTRAAVVDMVPEEQIKGVTETYMSDYVEYADEYSAEVKQTLINNTVSTQVETSKMVETVAQTVETASNERAAEKSADGTYTTSTQENNVRDKTLNEENEDKKVADTHVEKTETELKQAEFKEQALHQFSQVANSVTRKLETAGNVAVTTVVHEVVTADKNTQAGVEDFKKIAAPIAEAAAIIGMTALASSYSDQMKLLSKAGANIDKLVAEGKLSADDLLKSKKELNKQLKAAGVSSEDRKNILSNRQDIHDMMGVRSEMKSMAATGQIRIDEKLTEFLNGKEFFDLRKNEMGQLLQMYYRNSSDDVIRNTFGKGDFTGKSAKEFRKFLRKADKNEVSANGRAAIKMGQLAANRAKYNRMLSSHVHQKIKMSIKKMISNVTSSDKNTAEGFRTYSTVAKMSSFIGKGGIKVLIGTRKHGYKGLATQSLRVVKKIMIGTKKHGYKGVATQIGRSVIRFAKYTDKSFYALTNHSIGHFLSVSKTNIRNGAKAVRDGVRAGTDMAKKQALLAANKAKNKAASTAVGKKVVKANNARINATNAAVAKYKAAQNAARKAAQKIAQTKAAKAAYATGNAVAKGVDLFVGKPLRFGAGVFRKVKLAIGKVFNAFNVVKKFLIGAVGVFCFMYIIVALAIMGLLNLFNQDTTAIMNILLAERDEFVTESIERYQQKSDDINDTAVELGEGTPLTTSVTSGHTISKYGHPNSDGSWAQGYKIYYTDSNGNVIQNGSNNIKDTLVLAYVQMDGEWNESDEDKATKAMDDYFEWLNPSSSSSNMINNSEESDIYFCADGCETAYYKCSDSATLTATDHTYMSQTDIQTQKSNGTTFYGTITAKSGDYYVRKCKGHIISNTTTNEDGTTTTTYSTVNHGSKTNGTPSGCNNYSTTYYCTGHSIKACYGHRDISIYIPIKTMQDAFDDEYMASVSFFTFLSGGQWTEDDMDWCWCLYNADWYDLYGIDPNGGVGFTAGGSLTQEEIDAILDGCGDVSELRQNLMTTALSQVGSLPYFYGGKPTSGGLPIQTNVGQAGGSASWADHIGRTTAGLDCFGFCQWVYWNTTGSNVMPEGSNATTTTVYNSVQYGNLKRLSSASELKIGDLGFQAGHVGMFAGVNADGQLMWIHCTGGSNTVVYGTFNGFTRFYRLNGLE